MSTKYGSGSFEDMYRRMAGYKRGPDNNGGNLRKLANRPKVLEKVGEERSSSYGLTRRRAAVESFYVTGVFREDSE